MSNTDQNNLTEMMRYIKEHLQDCFKEKCNIVCANSVLFVMYRAFSAVKYIANNNGGKGVLWRG